MTAESDDSTTPTDGERACFEAGIKFGTLYHQFAGTPVSPKSAESLERAIEEAIGNQPYCESVSVEILTDELTAATEYGYTELTGRFMDVELVVERESRRITARMEMEEGYPMMRIESVEEIE